MIKYEAFRAVVDYYEQLISTIESSVQCQICMDLPDRPFA